LPACNLQITPINNTYQIARRLIFADKKDLQTLKHMYKLILEKVAYASNLRETFYISPSNIN
jgi:hypothetical protein